MMWMFFLAELLILELDNCISVVVVVTKVFKLSFNGNVQLVMTDEYD